MFQMQRIRNKLKSWAIYSTGRVWCKIFSKCLGGLAFKKISEEVMEVFIKAYRLHKKVFATCYNASYFQRKTHFFNQIIEKNLLVKKRLVSLCMKFGCCPMLDTDATLVVMVHWRWMPKQWNDRHFCLPLLWTSKPQQGLNRSGGN